MKEIVFILSSLCDPHYRKRVEEFVENGYKVTVYGFARKNQVIEKFPCEPIILGITKNASYKDRIKLYYKSFKSIASNCRGKLCFYSSLDIAMIARPIIRAKYIYEICDLTELAIHNHIIRKTLVAINKLAIKNSALTIFTSEGFLDFYKNIPSNKYIVIPNKVSPNCPPFSIEDRTINPTEKIKIGFVGSIRYETTYNFVKVCAEHFPNVEIHLFGIYSEGCKFAAKTKTIAEKYDNVIYHGRFKNPDDLPAIYSQIDMVLSAYTPCPSVIYAEPNKLYEAIYFRCPIIVNKNTFLSKKVDRLNIGYSIDALDIDSIKSFINNLSADSYNSKRAQCSSIDQKECINTNKDLFQRIANI